MVLFILSIILAVIDLYRDNRMLRKIKSFVTAKQSAVVNDGEKKKKQFTDTYDVEQLKVEWNEPNSIGVNEDIMMPDMRLKEIKPTLKNTTYATGLL